MEKVKLDNRQMPLHYQISEYLINMLGSGEIDPEDILMPEERLKEIFGVSRTTIRHALAHLLYKGLLFRKQGKGTFWTESACNLKREKLSGINRQIFNVTEKTSVKVLSKEVERGSDEVVKFLRLKDNNDVVVIKRLRSIDNEPMSFTINYLPPEYGIKIEKMDLEEMTMLETLERRLNIDLGTIEHEVEITRADSETSEYLNIAVLNPVLTVKTSVFDTQSNPVEIVWTNFIENRYKFRVVLDK